MSNWILLQNHKTNDMWVGAAVNPHGTLEVRWHCDYTQSVFEGPKSANTRVWYGSVTVSALLLPRRERLHEQSIHENCLLEDVLARLGLSLVAEKDEIAKLREDHEQHTTGLWDRTSGLRDEIADLKEEIADLRSQVAALMQP